MLEINTQFQKALDLMENTNRHLLITGKAGTGKTTLLNHFRQTTKKNVLVAAPTGTAAVNINGDTIHSLFGFNPSITVSKAKEMVHEGKFRKRKLLQNIDTLVIDEISMVRADLMDCIDIVLRGVRGSYELFGGVQMIFFGDLFQLPPVVQSDERQVLRKDYNGVYFFNSKVFEELLSDPTTSDFQVIELDKIYRQSDLEFIEILNAIRTRTFNMKQIEKLNERVIKSLEDVKIPNYIYLSTTNDTADTINDQNLQKLNGESKKYNAIISADYTRDRYPTQQVLELKVGARIMMLNNEQGGHWINGTLGWVRKMSDDMINVELDNGYIGDISPYSWEMHKPEYDEDLHAIVNHVAGSFTQIPVRLAWAITIHKSQGKTFENVVIDFGKFVFSEGQTYVAISRCTSMEGIYLVRPLRSNDVRIDFSIIKFFEGLKQLSAINNE
jgi:ATP-dependent exoDNAse (exonuclease V) alpha subunit